MTDERGPTADEVFYGGTSIPINDGPDESNVVSDMFFVAPDTLLVDEYEIIATQPIKLGEESEKEVYVLVTYKGRINNEDKLGSLTIIVRPEVIKNMITNFRHTYLAIPVELRE